MPAVFESRYVTRLTNTTNVKSGKTKRDLAEQLRQKVGGGNPTRLRQVWDEHLASNSVAQAQPVAELPVEVAEEVANVTKALTERIVRASSTTITNLVYMNCRRKDQTPNSTRLAWPG